MSAENPTEQLNHEVLIFSEAQGFLRTTNGSLRYLVQTNQVPYIRLGKRGIRFHRPTLEKWLRERQNVELHYPKAQARKAANGQCQEVGHE